MPRLFAFVLLLALAARGVTAGDFLQLDRAPKPDKLNADGIPVYSLMWGQGRGRHNACVEAIGEEGAQLYAERKGWKKLLTAPDKGKITRWFDQVWMDEKTGAVIIVEARGKSHNASFRMPADSLGHTRASIEWTIATCKDILTSKDSTDKVKDVARLVLEKISDGKLQIRVIVTTHARGTPIDTQTACIVRDVPDEYRGISPDRLMQLNLEKGKEPDEYLDDANKIEYVTESEREELTAQDKSKKKGDR